MFYRWKEHSWHWRMLYGFANILEGLVTVLTLGTFGLGKLSFYIICKSTKNNLEKERKT